MTWERNENGLVTHKRQSKTSASTWQPSRSKRKMKILRDIQNFKKQTKEAKVITIYFWWFILGKSDWKMSVSYAPQSAEKDRKYKVTDIFSSLKEIGQQWLTFSWFSIRISRYLITLSLKSATLSFSNLAISFLIFLEIFSKSSWPFSTLSSHWKVSHEESTD